MMKRMPRSFRKGHDGSLACRHRDASCCPQCAAQYEEIVDVYGKHFWVADAAEREALKHDDFKDVLDFLASEKCDGACLYWQMPNPFRGRDAAAAGVVREVDDLLVHPDATEIEAGMSYTMEKKT